jgi:circadian clock protein KaiB
MKRGENAVSDVYILKLFVVGHEPNSMTARANLSTICHEYLKDRFQLEEVDVLSDFSSALKERVFVTPALVLISPEPRVTVVGNLDNKERVISALRLRSNNGQ